MSPLLHGGRGGYRQKSCRWAALRLVSQDGNTPLWVASHIGHAGVVDQLIAGRADAESKSQVLMCRLWWRLASAHLLTSAQ